MNYLEASKLLKGFSAQNKEDVLLVMSGTAEQLVFYMRAEAAKRDVEVQISTLPFGTLSQFVYAQEPAASSELILLTTYDFVPSGDWRSGFSEQPPVYERIVEDAQAFADRLGKRSCAQMVYLPTPLLPMFMSDDDRAAIEAEMLALAYQLGARVLSQRFFSLASYLSTGCPLKGSCMGDFAELLDGVRRGSDVKNAKVLVTDLDNVLWAGIVGEDGPEGILAGPEGGGYPHYIYQNYLRKLKERGVLLAAVSRNDETIALAPFRGGKMLLNETDFIAIVASYNAKSAQIDSLSKQLNLGLDAFVFVDDNPVEIAEVTAALPQVTCLQFPTFSDDLPALFTNLAQCFNRTSISQEDRERTELYRRRLSTQPPSNTQGADLHTFLSTLDMKLTITQRTAENCERALQLLNKTNQFNLNGERFAIEHIKIILADGGRLFTASLSDKMGNHGEIIVCLLDATGKVLAWVMSCRVFQRQVEHAFLVWLAGQIQGEISFAFGATERNLPLQQFFKAAPCHQDDGQTMILDSAQFIERHTQALSLFTLEIIV